jgi:hypothetical protein
MLAEVPVVFWLSVGISPALTVPLLKLEAFEA